MEHNLLIFIIFLIFLSIVTTKSILFWRRNNIIRYKNLPPSPPSIPIIGNLLITIICNLHNLQQPVHLILHGLSQKYGPIFTLRSGSQLVAIISSASAAKECFTKHDIVFANRFQSIKTKYIGYDNTIMLSSSYGNHWRNLRRISSIQILSTNRLNSFIGIRNDETMRLLRNLQARNNNYSPPSPNIFTKVELRTMFADLTFNIIMRMVCGKRFYGDQESDDVEKANKFREVMDEMMKFGLGSNLGDFMPVYSWFDFGGYNKKLKRIGEKMDALFQGLVDEHRNKKESSSNTMIGHLLALQGLEPEYYTDQIIKGLIMTLIVAGTESSAITLEWAFSNLLNHPKVLEKAKIELDIQVGQDRLVEEEDVIKLPYLQNIISETLRLHPPAPMLLPHLSSEDSVVGGYDIPRNTMLLVNAWAIHRDPELWIDPTSFKPERFESCEVDMGGFIPFGMGRRACPGAGLAQRTLGLTLGSLIQCFEWKRIGEEDVDMTEGGGTLMPKAIPLEAQCKAHPIIKKIF